MHTELIDYMGDDLRVVNAARVSFDKKSEWEFTQTCCGKGYVSCCGEPDMECILSEKDQKLISYLARNNHWTPFSHVQITMRETVPIFVARQRFKHMVGFTYNEVSRRYVDAPPEFYYPDAWRGKPENAKQGSSDEVINWMLFHNNVETFGIEVANAYQLHIEASEQLYSSMIRAGVAPEQARMVLPQSMYTSYYVTGSLAAWARAYKLRSDPHAQKEIRDLASQWNEIIGNIEDLQYSWQALTNKEV